MTQWYVKDLSKLTGISVQTLHHYDRVNLLKPSLRQLNGYRVYSEKDLLQLQQIIALKFFGFKLSKIKALLTGTEKALENFSAQAQFLEQKANRLLDASQVLKSTISGVKSNKSIPWETIIQLIEVYHMTQQLEHAWVKEIFTPAELKQYVAFEAGLKSKSPAEKTDFENNWDKLIQEVTKNLGQDPHSKIGVHLGERCMQWVNGLYGKQYANLRTKMFEKGFGEGKGLEEAGLTPETVAWLDKAIDAYWQQRVYGILDQVGKIPASEVLSLWNAVLDDMYGDDVERKKAIVQYVEEKKISEEAKQWLKSL